MKGKHLVSFILMSCVLSMKVRKQWIKNNFNVLVMFLMVADGDVARGCE